MATIKEKKHEPIDVPVPCAPFSLLTNRQISNEEKVYAIQNYIERLQYNHTGFQFFEVRKDRPLIGLAEVARTMIDNSLPIKCLEALVLASYLLNEISYPKQNGLLNHVEKFPIAFKSISKGNVHRHVVLGVYCHTIGLFGAIGFSRRSSLGLKPLKFKTLNDLVQDYIQSYARFLHKVKRIKIGMPIAYSNRSFEPINWNGCTISPIRDDYGEWQRAVEKHSRLIRQNSLYSQQFNTQHVTSLSLKQLTNLNAFNQKLRKSNSYLNIHMNEIIKKREEEEEEREENSCSILVKSNRESSLTFMKNARKSATLTFNQASSNLAKRKKLSLRI